MKLKHAILIAAAVVAYVVAFVCLLNRKVEVRAAGVGLFVTKTEAAAMPIVYRVLPRSPAQRAGVLRGDHVLGINGESLFGVDRQKCEVMAAGKFGREVTYHMSRGGTQYTVVMSREWIQNDSTRDQPW